MFQKPLCSSETFTHLSESGLIGICAENTKKWKAASSNPFSDEIDALYERIRNKQEKTPLDISLLEFEITANVADDNMFFGHTKDFLFENPALLSYLAIGEILNDFEKYGFSSLGEFQKTIATLCIGDPELVSEKQDPQDYIWRNSRYRSKLSQMDTVGDLLVIQDNVSFGSSWSIEYSSQGFGGGQKGWGPFLISILKYAQAINALDIPEIANWRELTHGLRNNWSTIDCNNHRALDFSLKTFLDYRELLKEKCSSKLVNFIPKSEVVPYLQGENLLFIREEANGGFKLDTEYPPLKDRPLVIRAEFFPEDLPDLMKGIYKCYARSRGEVPAIMKHFLGEE